MHASVYSTWFTMDRWMVCTSARGPRGSGSGPRVSPRSGSWERTSNEHAGRQRHAPDDRYDDMSDHSLSVWPAADSAFILDSSSECAGSGRSSGQAAGRGRSRVWGAHKTWPTAPQHKQVTRVRPNHSWLGPAWGPRLRFRGRGSHKYALLRANGRCRARSARGPHTRERSRRAPSPLPLPNTNSPRSEQPWACTPPAPARARPRTPRLPLRPLPS